MAGFVYKCKYRNSDQYIEEQVRKYSEYYNQEINFEDYYEKINGCKLKHDGKDKCRLHDEVNGEAFSYSKSSKIWSCWGSCKVTAAGVVEYHMLFMKKTRPYFSMIDALKSLREMYPQLPAFDFKPKIPKAKSESISINRLKNKVDNYNKQRITGIKFDSDNIQDVHTSIDTDINKLCLFAFTHNYVDK